jgi:hypothetical protein
LTLAKQPLHVIPVIMYSFVILVLLLHSLGQINEIVLQPILKFQFSEADYLLFQQLICP